jgi:hypothetical protein
MKLQFNDSLIAEITEDFNSGVPLAELSFKYKIPVQRLQNMFFTNPTITLTHNISYGIKIMQRAERILLETAEDYHKYPKETKTALDSLLMFFSKADLNGHKWSNLEALVNNINNLKQ